MRVHCMYDIAMHWLYILHNYVLHLKSTYHITKLACSNVSMSIMLTYTNCTFCFYLCMALNIQMCTCCVLGCNTISFIVVHTPCPSIYNCTYACHIKAEHMGANGAVEMGSEMGYCCFAILLGQLLSFLDHSKYFTGQNFSTSRNHKSFSFFNVFK